MFSTQFETRGVEADAILPTKFGEFRIKSFYDKSSDKEHAMLYIGETSTLTPLVRIHSECLTGDAFGSLRCDCGPQLEASMKEIQTHGCGAIVYMRQEGRGIGLFAKIQAYALQDQGFDTLDANLQLGYPADARAYEFATVMLNSIGFKKIDLMTNNPDKILQLKESGIDIKSRVPIIVGTCEHNSSYLKTKSNRMGHLLQV